jgi:hypothetical protein
MSGGFTSKIPYAFLISVIPTYLALHNHLNVTRTVVEYVNLEIDLTCRSFWLQLCIYVFTESRERVADHQQLHRAGKGDLHRQQAVRLASTNTQDSPQHSPVVMRRKSSARANPAFRKSEGSQMLVGSVEGHQYSRAESEGGPGSSASKRDYYERLFLVWYSVCCVHCAFCIIVHN